MNAISISNSDGVASAIRESAAPVVADGVTHGFILTGTGLITVDVPGALFTFVRGITPGGHLAMGSYSLDKKSFRGFLLENGELTTRDYPGAATTTVLGVNARRDFVGDFNTDGSNLFHGYVSR